MTNEGKKLNTVRLQNISYGHKQSAALRAAMRTGSLYEDLRRRVDVCQGGGGPGHKPPECREADGRLRRGRPAGEVWGWVQERPGRGAVPGQGETHLHGPMAGLCHPRLRDSRKDLKRHLSTDAPPRRLGLYEDLTDEMAREYHEATYSVGLGTGLSCLPSRWI